MSSLQSYEVSCPPACWNHEHPVTVLEFQEGNCFSAGDDARAEEAQACCAGTTESFLVLQSLRGQGQGEGICHTKSSETATCCWMAGTDASVVQDEPAAEEPAKAPESPAPAEPKQEAPAFSFSAPKAEVHAVLL